MNKLLSNLKMIYKIILLAVIMVFFMILSGAGIYNIFLTQEKSIFAIFGDGIKKAEISTAILENVLNTHNYIFDIISLEKSNHGIKINDLNDRQKSVFDSSINEIDNILKTGNLSVEEKVLFNESLTNMNEYRNSALKILDAVQTDTEAVAAFTESFNKKFSLMKNTLDKIKKIQNSQNISNYNSTVRKTMTFFIFILCIFAACLIIISVFVGRAIVNPISMVIADIKMISKGDFTKKIQIRSKDEIGELAVDFEHLKNDLNKKLLLIENISDKLNGLSGKSISILENSAVNMDSIQAGSKDINLQTENSTSGIEELTATLEEMSRNIESIMNNMVKQASAVEEGASSIEEMVRNIENTTSMSKKTHDISNNLNNVANEGGNAVKNSIQSIKDVSDYSQQIIKLLGLITNIAKQTNLLAMNAAIEAAHAGEAGKGFAIVADEIRRLSEDTNKNARDIGDVVGTIVSRIDDSVRLAEKAGIGLDMITMYSQQNVQIIDQLNIAMAEQNNGAKEILASTQDLVKITDEVKISMVEQKGATDDFGEALKNLRDMSLGNKNSLVKFIENIKQLISYIGEMKSIIDENKKQADLLHDLAAGFMLENISEEETGLKLVE